MRLFVFNSVVLFKFVDKNSFLAYALTDGTIGVYRESIRLWRIKVVRIEGTNKHLKSKSLFLQSKSKGTSLASFDLLGSGKNQLIVGWESGRVSSTNINLFKNHNPISIPIRSI